jgi:26S proteasome regulatory subunit, ATPase 3, interacting protein
MSDKKKADVRVLKGQEGIRFLRTPSVCPLSRLLPAEDRILAYMKALNRPFGAVDVAANLKGAVPKATTQKILLSLTEKGHLVQKTYGYTFLSSSPS